MSRTLFGPHRLRGISARLRKWWRRSSPPAHPPPRRRPHPLPRREGGPLRPRMAGGGGRAKGEGRIRREASAIVPAHSRRFRRPASRRSPLHTEALAVPTETKATTARPQQPPLRPISATATGSGTTRTRAPSPASTNVFTKCPTAPPHPSPPFLSANSPR